MRRLALLLPLIAVIPLQAQQTPPDSGRVYEMSEVEVLPRARNSKAFTEALAAGYPHHLREARVGGAVQVDFVVGPDGEPRNVRVLSSPDSSFDAPSVQAVSVLRFTPARVGGSPVAVRVEQPITWQVVEPTVIVMDERGRCEGDDRYELSEVEELPRRLNGAEFQQALTREAARLGEHMPQRGTVQVRFLLEPDGTVSCPTVMQSTFRGLDSPTLRIVQMLHFRPARLDGRPVHVWVELPIQWERAATSASGTRRHPD
jgi:TonB family protein